MAFWFQWVSSWNWRTMYLMMKLKGWSSSNKGRGPIHRTILQSCRWHGLEENLKDFLSTESEVICLEGCTQQPAIEDEYQATQHWSRHKVSCLHEIWWDGGHCFLKCKGVRQCWREMNMEMIRVRLLAKENSKEFVREILHFKPKTEHQSFLASMEVVGHAESEH